jgi:hypothetical protein
MTGKTQPWHPAGQLRWHDADHSLATQQGPRRSRAHYRAEMTVTGQERFGSSRDTQPCTGRAAYQGGVYSLVLLSRLETVVTPDPAASYR